MAIDTEDKRFSFVNIGLGWGRVFSKPDGAIAAEDRRQALPIYSGIALTAVTIPAILKDLTTLFVSYIAGLRTAGGVDSTTLFSQDASRIAAAFERHDVNTEIAIDQS